jgi:hypothetical protein
MDSPRGVSMYLAVAGACAEQEAGSGSPLAATVSTPSDLQIPVFADSSPGTTSAAGEISSTVTASGGTPPYVYSWSLSEQVDDEGGFSIASQGSPTNQATYNTATISTTFTNPSPAPPPAPPPPPPPAAATYRVTCQVTDQNGAGDTVSASQDFTVDAVPA